MKWIKASEMLSPDLRAIHIKRPPNGFPVIGHYVPSKNQYWIPIYGEYWDIEKVEWLDESAESDSGEQVRKLREGLEDCDTLLAHLEDYAHGDGGKMITQQRGKIQQLLTETEG